MFISVPLSALIVTYIFTKIIGPARILIQASEKLNHCNDLNRLHKIVSNYEDLLIYTRKIGTIGRKAIILEMEALESAYHEHEKAKEKEHLNSKEKEKNELIYG